MNPWHLSASELLIWGIVLHLVADWPLQNDWIANNKQSLSHPAGYVHAGLHGLLLALVFGLAAIPLAVAHLLIDTRKPLQWWSRLVRQTQPVSRYIFAEGDDDDRRRVLLPVYDMGSEVRIWTDQVFHIICVAVAALLIGG